MPSSPTSPTTSRRSSFDRLSFTEALQSFSGALTNDGDTGIRLNGFMPSASPLRRSISEYYPNQTGYFNAAARPPSLEITGRPPSYYNFGDSSLPPARFKIHPREEEGKEKLPGYSCTISKDAVFPLKMELSSPFARARDRAWRNTYIALKGTALFLHRPKRRPFFGKTTYVGEDPVLEYLPGKILKCYTLQGAEVGIAADYKKRHYTIRLRAETDQFIFCPKTLEQLVLWTEAIGAAIDLSPSLDERSLPRYQTIPRRRRPRPAEQVINEQAIIIQRHYPNLAVGDGALTRASTNLSTPLQPIREGVPLRIPDQQLGELQRQSTQETITSMSLRSIVEDLPPDEEQSDGKPELVTVPEEVNQRYAKRCMAVLVADAPRQCDWIIWNGKRWKVLWEKKVLVSDEGEGEDEPPSYDMIVRV